MYALLWVGGIQIVGTRSKVAAQVEVHVHVCIVVGGWATDSGLEIEMAAQVEVQVWAYFRCIHYG